MVMCESVRKLFMEPSEEGWTVLQTGQDKRDPMQVVRALADLSGVAAVDLSPTVHRRHGPIILEGLRPELAQGLAERLRDWIPCKAVPAAEVRAPVFFGVAHTVDYGEGGLKLESHREQISVAWDEMLLLSAGWVENIHDERGHAVAEKQLLADLFFLREAHMEYVRLLARQLPYAHLGERIASSTLENFRLVLGDLVRFAPGAQTNDGVRTLLEGKPLPSVHPFRSPEAFDEENLPLLGLPW